MLNKDSMWTSVLGFIKQRGVYKILIILLLGVALIIIGTSSVRTNEDGDLDELEARLEEMCSSLVGVGRCRVMVTYERSNSRYGAESDRRVESVAIVCRGADNVRVRSELTELFTSLFGIGAHRISITRMK